jgi:ribosome-binding protein aMBF1 (putative translation factor)
MFHGHKISPALPYLDLLEQSNEKKMLNSVLKDLGTVVRTNRERCGMSQKTLAERADFTPPESVMSKRASAFGILSGPLPLG